MQRQSVAASKGFFFKKVQKCHLTGRAVHNFVFAIRVGAVRWVPLFYLPGIGTLPDYDGDGNGNVKNTIGFMSKTNDPILS